jgi:hypothetical protein
VIEEKTLIVSPPAGLVNWATGGSSALTTGIIADSRATMEMIKVFKVDRIVQSERFVVDLWVRNRLDYVKNVANTGDFICSCSATRYLREEMLP